MKYNISLLFVLLLSACQLQSSEQQGAENQSQVSKNEVNSKLAKALVNKDYRLMAITGRRIVLPGISAEDVSSLVQSCGFKAIKGYKDHYQTPEQKRALQKLRYFAKAYNQQMRQYCLQHLGG